MALVHRQYIALVVYVDRSSPKATCATEKSRWFSVLHALFCCCKMLDVQKKALRRVVSTMRDDVGKVAASMCLMLISWVVLYQSCLRASTIYFFELDTTSVIFVNRLPALIFPFALSILLYFVYIATKRSAEIDEERVAAQEAEKELRATSVLPSRKASRETSRRQSLSIIEESNEQQQRIRRLLSDIDEQDVEATIHNHRLKLSQRSENPIMELFDDGESSPPVPISEVDKSSTDSADKSVGDVIEEEDGEAPPQRKLTRSRFVVENVEDGEKILIPPASSIIRNSSFDSPMLRSRSNSKSIFRCQALQCLGLFLARFQLGTEHSFEPKIVDLRVWQQWKCDMYKRLGEIDLFSCSMSALSLIPRSDGGPRVYLELDLLDIIAELFAVHMPIWGCVACLHIILLEIFNMHLSFYFYYHEESMVYTAMALSFLYGLAHEFYGNWITNDILAFASIYVVSCRIQAVSYQTAVVFMLGMVLFDLFWLYVIDLLTTVSQDNRAPLMIRVPRDKNGNKQSLATVDIIIPGAFMNVVLKYSSMYDTHLFAVTFGAVFAAIVVTMLFSIWKSKVLPAMVLPAIVGIGVSLGCASHPEDLWRFMIKT
ncbi:unnamed protein product [Caenorhabditis auriculariae]|uniref:Uncharacterized protein n=1 Tax=Caenorhabditis auriculariae TaxID=2777116 RepID=A0A8S1HVA2_9PELO|nr:unnamed protein product [Caenorhabditis auriculariae]